MSRRALRRLRGESRGQGLLGEEPPLGGLDEGGSGEDEDEEGTGDEPQPVSGGGRRRRRRRGPRREPLERVANPFELINSEGLDEDLASKEDIDDSWLQEGGDPRTKEDNPGGLESDRREEGGEAEQLDQMSIPNNKSRKKKKKRKNKKNPSGEALFPGDDDQVEDLESILLSIENCSGPPCQSQSRFVTDNRPLLYIEHRNLNPETELKRYFGARAVLGDQRPRQRQRQYVRSTWLTAPKETWPRHSKTGISMVLLETRRGEQRFAFEHNREYQLVQFKFLDAVESMDPNNLVLLLQMNPYHVDSLLQLSDVCRMQEDQEMARDLTERALYTLECAFHPVFSLTSGTCRLDYRHPENRAFYLALFKHLLFLERRGCPRTALEVCKLVLSLDPENDPLCMLLMVDLLSLRAREYAFLIRMFQEWEGHRNLSQLPNFAFSVPLAHFFLSQQEDISEAEHSRAREQADGLIQQALIMFPSALMPLLDRCSVQPDSVVASHAFFGLEAQLSVPSALSQLVSLYLGRSHALWKDPAVMAWLETNVHKVLRVVDAKDPALEEAEQRWAQSGTGREAQGSCCSEAFPSVHLGEEALARRSCLEEALGILSLSVGGMQGGDLPAHNGIRSSATSGLRCFIHKARKGNSPNQRKHFIALFSLTVAKLQLTGGSSSRRRRAGCGAKPQPGSEPADGGYAGHAGKHPVPGTPTGRQP